MNQILDSARIAIQSIWANKLRSLLTVLGNIVAVTSIIAVVSLVQGLNTAVKDAIQSGLGVDSFIVQRTGRANSDEEQERMQRNPIVTLEDADAIRRLSPDVAFVVAQANSGAQAKYRGDALDSLSIQGVTREFI